MSPRPPKLLTREEFREAVFARDGGKCVLCDEPAADAHHIIDRALWTGGDHPGGSLIDNGASVCAEHHMKCETTETSVEEVRAAAGIKTAIVPEQFELGQKIDKWGNTVLPNGQRMRGEMFEREGVRKMLTAGGVLHLFTHLIKYPRTPHCPWSTGGTKDDSRIRDFSRFEGRRTISTVKMDGENSTLYRDHYHARSIDGRHHPSRDWLKGFWSSIRHEIPENYRICGENLFAVHSIEYQALSTYFLGFSVWTDKNECLGWDDTLEWFDLLGVAPVEVLRDDVFDLDAIRAISMPTGHEGSVHRLADAIPYAAFRECFFKVVRANHVQTDQHWMHGEIKRNGLILPDGFPEP
jgi:hypothetical protein